MCMSDCGNGAAHTTKKQYALCSDIIVFYYVSRQEDDTAVRYLRRFEAPRKIEGTDRGI